MTSFPQLFNSNPSSPIPSRYSSKYRDPDHGEWWVWGGTRRVTIIIRQVCRTGTTLDWPTHFSQPRRTAPLSSIVHHTGLLRQLPCYTELHRAKLCYTVLQSTTKSYTVLHTATGSLYCAWFAVRATHSWENSTGLHKNVVELKESKESNVIAKQIHRIFKYNGLVGKNIYDIFACTMCTRLTTRAIVERRC